MNADVVLLVAEERPEGWNGLARRSAGDGQRHGRLRPHAGGRIADGAEELLLGAPAVLAELGDPLVYARHITSPAPLNGQPTAARNVLQIEVIFDELVTNEGGEALARAGGYPLAKPNVGSNSELFDFTKPPRGIPLLEASPDAMGAIHDVPVIGSTAVVLQDSPAGHGSNFVRSKAKREWKAPYALFGTNAPFTHFDPKDFYEVRTGYRDLQATATSFIGDAFANKTPSVVVRRPPIRDLDDDGNPDSTDPNPNDPRIK